MLPCCWAGGPRLVPGERLVRLAILSSPPSQPDTEIRTEIPFVTFDVLACVAACDAVGKRAARRGVSRRLGSALPHGQMIHR